MANKYGGSWAKGFASTFDPVGGINLGLQWKEKKKAQQKIDDAIEQLKNNSMELAAKFDAARADGTITQEEYGDAMAWAMPLGKEIMGKTNDIYANYQNWTPEKLQTELDNIDAVYQLSKDLDFQNIEEMKEFGSKLTQPDAIMQWDLIIKSIEGRGRIEQPEVFTSPTELQAKYPGSSYTYSADAGGYVPKPKEEPSVAEKKYDWAIKAHQRWVINPEDKTGINFEEFKKYMGITPEKATGLEKTIQDTIREGNKAGISQDEINTAIKNKIVGVDVVGEPFDLNDFLFGSDGIMKDYSTGGGRLMPEDIEGIINNYNIKKNLLKKENQKQVEDFLSQSGIDINAVTPETVPETVPEPSPLTKGITAVKDWLGQKGETIESRRGLGGEIPTPKVPTGAKEAQIPLMTKEELEEAIKGLDPSDPMYKLLYDEAVKRGYTTK